MTRNPYAQMGNFDDPRMPGGHGDFVDGGPPRTSALAVASLIVSIVSLVVCCVPGPGILGMFLAVGAMVSISASQGRRTGMGMAIAGMVIGLVSTIIAVAIWWMMAAGLSQMGNHRTTLEAMWARDVSATAASFDPGVAPRVTTERIEDFVQAVESEMGAFKDIPAGMWPMWSGYRKIQLGIPVFEKLGQQGPSNIQPAPVPAEFDNGWATVLLDLAPGGAVAPNGNLAIRNVGIGLPSGRIVWLLDISGTTVPLIPPVQPAPPAQPSPPALPGGDPAGTDEPPAPPAPPTAGDPEAGPAADPTDGAPGSPDAPGTDPADPEPTPGGGE